MEHGPNTVTTLIRTLAGLALSALSIGSTALAGDDSLPSSWEKALGQPVEIAPSLAPTTPRWLSLPGFDRYGYSVEDLVTLPESTKRKFSYGMFELQDGGKVCVNLRDTPGNCNFFLKSRGILFMLTDRSNRFPVGVEIELH